MHNKPTSNTSNTNNTDNNSNASKKPKKSPPTAKEIYDTYAHDYNGRFAPTTFQTFRASLSFANDLTWHYLRKYLPREFHAVLADIGGGDGYWSEKFIQAGYSNIVLTDISEQMLKEARKRLTGIDTIRYEQATILDMPTLPTASFDFVCSLYDPVSYSLDPGKAMQELARIAKDDAYVFVTLDTKFRRVPELIAARQIDAAEELLAHNLSYDFGHPQFNLTWEELAKNFSDAGLEVIEMAGIPVFLHQVDPDVLKSLTKDTSIRSRLLSMELAHGTDRSLINFAGHLLMVGKKQIKKQRKK